MNGCTSNGHCRIRLRGPLVLRLPPARFCVCRRCRENGEYGELRANATASPWLYVYVWERYDGRHGHTESLQRQTWLTGDPSQALQSFLSLALISFLPLEGITLIFGIRNPLFDVFFDPCISLLCNAASGFSPRTEYTAGSTLQCLRVRFHQLDVS